MSPRISISLLAAQPDKRLVALASDGHERAFEALVHRYRRPLLRYARRIGLEEARAEDVVQQAFMKAWIALDRGDEVRDARSWLYQIVHNAALNALRGPAEEHGELTEAVEERAALVGASNLERRIALRDALSDVAALPRMQRQAIFLTAVDGQSHDEVAGRLGITPGAVRGLLHRARTTLRSAAAAVIPQPLLEFAARSGEAGAPAAERVLELTTGGAGAAGAAGLLLKAGVAVVTAGTLAAGTSVVLSHDHGGTPHARSQAEPALRASAQEGLNSQPVAAQLGGQSASGKGLSSAKMDRRGQSQGRADRSGRGGGGEDRRRGRHSQGRGEDALEPRSSLVVVRHRGRDSQLVAGSAPLRRGDGGHRGSEGSRGRFGGEDPEASDADRSRRHHDRHRGQGGESVGGRDEPLGGVPSAFSEDAAGTATAVDDGSASGSDRRSSGSGSSGSGDGQSGSDGQTAQSTPAS
jgi:RNA polymerase sigma factor (sigma-70 family)